MEKKVAAKLVLGIDAGATKVTAAVADKKTILGSGTAGSANIHTTPANQLISHLASAVKQALRAAHLPITTKFHNIVVGMAGIDSKIDETLAKRLINQAIGKYSKTITVLNDIHIVLRSGSNQPYGIALIAGTGAQGFGINSTGKTWQVGGLEYLISDEGSACALGLKAMRAALQSSDGRIKKTTLELIVKRYFKLRNLRALEPIIYHQPVFPKKIIAQLAPLVNQAALKKDWRAKEIVNETLSEILSYIQALVKNLNMQQDTFDLVLVGGVFKLTANHFKQNLFKRICKLAPRANIILPKTAPVLGAVRLAQAKLPN
ncbi:MAG: BadF/BadG/BcrA/BcrD ATPase family protein [Patescibacteria group bacterium]|jgi:N-acetylglucosamine kinase-like BadF-type ATPase